MYLVLELIPSQHLNRWLVYRSLICLRVVKHALFGQLNNSSVSANIVYSNLIQLKLIISYLNHSSI